MKKLLFLLALITFGFASCVQQSEGDNDVNNTSNATTFNVIVPNGGITTRAVEAVAGENNVDDLTLLFFEQTSDKKGAFIGYHKVSDADLKDTGEFNFDISFSSESGLTKSSAYDFLAMANVLRGNYFKDQAAMDAFLEDLSANKKTMDVVKKEMVKMVKGQDITDPINLTNPLLKKEYVPMSGDGYKLKGEDNVALSLIRVVSRFDVQNSAPGYELTNASVFNAFSYPSLFDGVEINYEQARTEFFYGVAAGTDSDGNRSQSITGGLYSTVNNVSNPTQNDKKTTCLIIGLRKLDETSTKYYRVNINPEGVGQYLKRNNVYKVVISKVNIDGKTTAKAAYESGEESLDVAINTWDRDEDGLILSNGDNMLALPTIKAMFGPDAETRVYSIFTMGQGTLKMELLQNGEYVEIPDATECTVSSDESEAGSIRATRNGTTLTITADAYSGDVREGTLRFSFAGLVGDMAVLQDGTAKKQLKLSHTTVPNYPAGGSATNMITDPILISSSGQTVGTTVGPWTGTILLSNGFSFDASTEVLVKHGGNGDKIDKLYALGVNGSEKPLINFILVTLDEDPSNFRNVIVLTQNANGRYTLTPNVSVLQFNADKTVYPNQKNLFTAHSGEATDNWEINIKNNIYDTDKQKFKLFVTEDNLTNEVATLPYQVNGKSGVTFSVEPVADNYFGNLSATLTVKQNSTNNKEVSLVQDYYKMTVSPLTKKVSAAGEKVTISVVLAASGKKMSATLSHNLDPDYGYTPTFGDGTSSLSGVDVNNFDVIIPSIKPKYGHLLTEDPTVTIKITIDGTELAETVVITQDKPELTPFNVHTLHDSYGRWTNTGGLFYGWRTFMGNPSLFGPSGEVWAPSNIGGFDNISYTNVIASDVRVWNVNQHNYTTNFARLSSNWMGKENHFVILSTYNQYNMFSYIFGSGNNGGYSCQGGFSNPSRDQTPNSAPTKSRETELWKYLVGGDGPFGEVDVTNIRNLGGGDTNAIGLTQWPSNFIPLIMSSSSPNRCMVGIDPTNRFIWVGDTEIFHTNAQNNYGNLSSEESKFFQNIIAYITNVALYGDTFNNQFKVK